MANKSINELLKYGAVVPFTRPNLTSNGTVGQNNFAVTSTNCNGGVANTYKLFDGNVNYTPVGFSNPFYIIIYNPTPLKISSFNFKNAEYPPGIGYPFGPTYISGSNNGIDYTSQTSYTNTNGDAWGSWTLTIPSTNMSFYKYTKIYVTNNVSGNAGYGSGEAEINFSAVTLL